MRRAVVRGWLVALFGFASLCRVEGQGAILPAEGLPGPCNEVVFLGDSLTQGAGLRASQAYPAVIGRYWARNGVSLKAINEGVGGNTTSDLVHRLDQALSERTCLVFLEIGPNDGFGRRAVGDVRRDLSEVVARVQERGIRVVLAEMWLPMEVESTPQYREAFDAMYGEVAERYGIPLMPAFLHSVISRAHLWQRDGIHPTADGDWLVARDVLRFLNPAWKLD